MQCYLKFQESGKTLNDEIFYTNDVYNYGQMEILREHSTYL